MAVNGNVVTMTMTESQSAVGYAQMIQDEIDQGKDTADADTSKAISSIRKFEAKDSVTARTIKNYFPAVQALVDQVKPPADSKPDKSVENGQAATAEAYIGTLASAGGMEPGTTQFANSLHDIDRKEQQDPNLKESIGHIFPEVQSLVDQVRKNDRLIASNANNASAAFFNSEVLNDVDPEKKKTYLNKLVELEKQDPSIAGSGLIDRSVQQQVDLATSIDQNEEAGTE